MLSACLAIIIGLLLGVGCRYLIKGHLHQISQKELLIGGAIIVVTCLIVGPLTEHIILGNETTYQEFLNGYELSTNQTVTQCDRDGDCQNTYDCDPYTVVTEDSKGHIHVHTEYHQCPYLKQEYTYSVDTTLGAFNVDGVYSDKQRTPWDNTVSVPGDIPVGPPQQWLAAKNRIDSGKNGGVTELHSYTNYYLASNLTILKSYSADIDRYGHEHLLPDIDHNYANPIHDLYMADKFMVIPALSNENLWQEYLGRLNGYLGYTLQGDVHMVAVNASSIDNPDTYSQAVFAYWKGDLFGKYDISKNTIALIIGVNNGIIAWARAAGGLPNGNEALYIDLQNNLVGVPFTPDAVIGIPHGSGKNFSPGNGALAQNLWGIHKFARPCMECVNKGQIGYNYLASDITITGSQRFWIVFWMTLFSISMWVTFLYIDNKYWNETGFDHYGI